MSTFTSGEPQTSCSSFSPVNNDSMGTGMIHPIPSRTASIWRSISCIRYCKARSTYSTRFENVNWIFSPLGTIGTKRPLALCVSNDSMGMIWKRKKSSMSQLLGSVMTLKKSELFFKFSSQCLVTAFIFCRLLIPRAESYV